MKISKEGINNNSGNLRLTKEQALHISSGDIFEAQKIFQEGVQVLTYQQGIHDKNGRHIKSESLLRLVTPDGNIILPDDCVPILDSEQLRTITHQIILQTLEFSNKDGIDFTINLGMAQVQDIAFLENLRSTCLRYNVGPEKVTLELLETIPENFDDYLEKFAKVARRMGFKIAIDDYGALFSTLNRAEIIHPDIVKLDGIHTQSMNPKNTLSRKQQGEVSDHLRALLDFTRNTGATIIAEHVQNEGHIHILGNLGICHFQGFHFSTPKPIK